MKEGPPSPATSTPFADLDRKIAEADVELSKKADAKESAPEPEPRSLSAAATREESSTDTDVDTPKFIYDLLASEQGRLDITTILEDEYVAPVESIGIHKGYATLKEFASTDTRIGSFHKRVKKLRSLLRDAAAGSPSEVMKQDAIKLISQIKTLQEVIIEDNHVATEAITPPANEQQTKQEQTDATEANVLSEDQVSSDNQEDTNEQSNTEPTDIETVLKERVEQADELVKAIYEGDVEKVFTPERARGEYKNLIDPLKTAIATVIDTSISDFGRQRIVEGIYKRMINPAVSEFFEYRRAFAEAKEEHSEQIPTERYQELTAQRETAMQAVVSAMQEALREAASKRPRKQTLDQQQPKNRETVNNHAGTREQRKKTETTESTVDPLAAIKAKLDM